MCMVEGADDYVEVFFSARGEHDVLVCDGRDGLAEAVRCAWQRGLVEDAGQVAARNLDLSLRELRTEPRHLSTVRVDEA